jgi:hypothetical protein
MPYLPAHMSSWLRKRGDTRVTFKSARSDFLRGSYNLYTGLEQRIM